MVDAWEPIPSFAGDTVGCLVGVTEAGSRDLVLAGTGAGVFASRDEGQTWRRLTGGDPPSRVTAIAPSPHAADNGALFAVGAHGIYRTTGGDGHWRRLLDAPAHAILALSQSDADPLLIAGTELDGILRSPDGGTTWDSANPGLLDTTVLSLAVAAGTATARVLLAGAASGIYLSRIDGKAWRLAALPAPEAAVQCLAVLPDRARDRLAFAGTERHGLLRSDDGGLTWTSVPLFDELGISTIVFAAQAEPLLVLAAGGRQIALSDDRGASWRRLLDAPAEIAAIWAGEGPTGWTLLAGLYEAGVARLAIDRTG